MKTIRSTRFLVFALVGLLTITSVLFGSAQPVLAAAPVITSDVISVTNPAPIGVDCGAFQVLATFTVERQNITFYDEAGNKLRQIRNASFTGILYNSVTNASVPYEGSFNRTEDFVAHTVTFTGLRLAVRIPGQGILALDVGQTVLDFSTNPPAVTVEAGQHDFNTQICQLLG
jgi:hypothetical protein